MRAEELTTNTLVPAEIRIERGSAREVLLERLRRALEGSGISWEERREGESTVLVYTLTLGQALELGLDSVGGGIRPLLLSAYPGLAEDRRSLDRRLELLKARAPR